MVVRQVTVPPGGGTVAVTITASPSAAPNRYSFYLFASGGDVSSSPQSVILRIPNFVLTTSGVQTIAPGGSATVTAYVAAVGVYSASGSLSYSGPAGITISGPSAVAVGGTLSASVGASSSAAAGSYPTVTGNRQ